MRGALVLLQRPLLEGFHKRIWSDKPDPPVDIHHPDKQVSSLLPGQGMHVFRPEVGKIRPGCHMWPDELLNPARRGFTINSLKAK